MAVASSVDICNLALAYLGGGEDMRTISAIADPDPTSVLCNRFYDIARKETLKRGLWQEVLYYAELSQSGSFSGEKAEWEYVCDLPADSLHIVRQTDEQYHRITYPHEIKQGKLFTNVLSNEAGDKAYVEYVKNETSVAVFSNELVYAMSIRLAAELAAPIIGGVDGLKRREALLEEFEKLILPTSRAISQSQQYHDEDPRLSKFSWLGERPYYEDDP